MTMPLWLQLIQGPGLAIAIIVALAFALWRSARYFGPDLRALIVEHVKLAVRADSALTNASETMVDIKGTLVTHAITMQGVALTYAKVLEHQERHVERFAAVGHLADAVRMFARSQGCDVDEAIERVHAAIKNGGRQ